MDTITSGTGFEEEVKFNRNCIGPAVTMRVAVVSWKGVYVWSYLRAYPLYAVNYVLTG